LGLLPRDADEYVLTSGAFKGQRGFFTRDEKGAVVGVDLAGRLYSRVQAASLVSSRYIVVLGRPQSRCSSLTCAEASRRSEASRPTAPLITERGWCTSPEAHPRP